MDQQPAQIDLSEAVDQLSSAVAPPTPFGEAEFAGFGRRLAAFVLDSAWYGLSLLAFLVAVAVGTGEGGASIEGTRMLVVAFGWSLVWEITWIASPSRGKPGQRMAGFRVVRPDGSRVSLGRAALRWGVRMLMWPTSGLTLLVSAVMVHATPRSQALHDLVAQTVCVRGAALQRIREPQFAGSIALQPQPSPTAQPSSSGPFL